MSAPFIAVHGTDSEGNPAGGIVYGTGFEINWQRGPLVDPETGERLEQTGAFVEHVLMALIDRMEYYQGTRFACTHNAAAIAHMRLALEKLNERTRERQLRGVEGTHRA